MKTRLPDIPATPLATAADATVVAIVTAVLGVATATATAAQPTGRPAATTPAEVPPAEPTDLEPGWRWALEPTRLSSSWPANGFRRLAASGVLSMYATHGGRLVVDHVRTTDLELRGSRAPEFRVVVRLDDDSELGVTASSSMSRPNAAVHSYYLSSVDDPAHVATIGLAVLDFDGRRVASNAAAAEATRLGASVLPLPVVGEPFEFDLPAMEGTRVRSKEFRGQVVLIDAWASW